MIITTRKEYDELKSRYTIENNNILFDDELNGDNAIIKAKIVKMLKRCNKSYSNKDDVLLIGIDPGKRIGLTVLYMYNELDSRVMVSIQDTVYTIEKIIKDIQADRCIVKIGYGERKTAKEIAKMLHMLLMNKVEIELVDEHGTSRCTHSNKRGIKDKISAKAIALRKGIPFKP